MKPEYTPSEDAFEASEAMDSNPERNRWLESSEQESVAIQNQPEPALVAQDFGASEVIAESAEEVEESELAEQEAEPEIVLEGEELVQAKTDLEKRIVDALHTIFDPEIPVDIYELGLIYDIRIADNFDVVVQMTLTSPACPVAGTLPLEVEDKTLAVDGVKTARAELVWDPPWTPELMSEAAQLELGFF